MFQTACSIWIFHKSWRRINAMFYKHRRICWSGTMMDTWSTVGLLSIRKNCHLSGGVGIGGVLEPVQAAPTIIEDNCFIGARVEVAEGVIVEKK